jgi:hypothetical protein
MNLSEKYDKLITGLISGLTLPFFIALIAFLFSKGNPSLHTWLKRIADADIITHMITLCVFPNLLLFLLFNRFDMLRASRGVLGVTFIWAIIVFTVKILR